MHFFAAPIYQAFGILKGNVLEVGPTVTKNVHGKQKITVSSKNCLFQAKTISYMTSFLSYDYFLCSDRVFTMNR